MPSSEPSGTTTSAPCEASDTRPSVFGDRLTVCADRNSLDDDDDAKSSRRALSTTGAGSDPETTPV